MPAAALRLERVSFVYPQQGFGLPPFSLSLEAGEAVLLNGSSGSGKSTLARLACGLIPHLYRGRLTGRAWLYDLPTGQTELWRLSEQAGLVFQNPAAQILATSVEEEIIFGLENLGLSPSEGNERLESVLRRFGLAHLRRRAPQKLSGGEQQKLALACMLARHTPLLVLDEPLSMLDSTAAHELVEYLEQLQSEGHSLLICEHRQVYLQRMPALRTVSLNGASSHAQPVDVLPPVPGGAPSPFRLQVEQLAVKRGGVPVLQGINFTLESGQVAALIGQNGAGKTTLLRALAGLQPYTGSLQVSGATGPHAPTFSMVFQNPDLQLFNPTVQEEILYRVKQPDLQWFAWLLQALKLERYQDTPPLLLSEGEKRRVALATALMRSAAHGVLLDEPSLGQDSSHKTILAATLRALAQAGYLVMMATHDLELAACADTLLLLTPQGILAQGPTREILGQPALWQKLGLRLPDWLEAPA